MTEVQTRDEIFSFVDTDEEETLICVFDKNGDKNDESIYIYC